VKITSGASPSLFRFSGSGIPYFKVEQLSNSEKYLSATDTPYHFERGDTVPANSVVFAKRGAAIALNKVRILKEESFMDTNLMALTPQGGLDCEYLYYALTHIGLWQFADTTSVPQINNKHVKPLPFPLPCPAEQKVIAGALADVDALLEGLDRLIGKKRDLKRAAMQQFLTGQTRLPGFSGEWETRPLSSLCLMKSGEGITSADIDTFSPYPCFGGNGLRGYTSRFTHDGHFALIGRQGALCGNVTSAVGKFFASEHAVVVTPSRSADIRWLTHVLATMNLNRFSESSAQPGLSVSKVLMLEIRVPPTVEEQTAIATVLSDMDAEITALGARRDKTRHLKQAMMQELLTGKTRLVPTGGARD
jgi:type I restriction enzyme S subunit